MRVIDGITYYTRPEAAELLGISRHGVAHYTRNGRLKSIKLEHERKGQGLVLIARGELNRFAILRASKFEADKLFRGKKK